MACPYNKNNTVIHDQQHQRSASSNVTMSNNPGMDAQVDAHFKKSMDNVTIAGQAKWQDKDLPESFFKPAKSNAASVGHSRDGSTDSSGCCSTQSPQSTVGPVHYRAHSSPANLNANQLSIPQKASKRGGPHSDHLRIRSVDIESIDVDDQQPLPPGWQRAYSESGQPYFIKYVYVQIMFLTIFSSKLCLRLLLSFAFITHNITCNLLACK